MKKLLVLILSVIAAFTAIISLTACEAKVDKDGNVTITDGDKSSNDNNGGSDSSGSGSQGGSETGGEQGGSETGGNEDSGKLSKTEIRSKNLIVSGNEIKGKVANAQTTFSFINDIEVADGATYTVCTDLACTKSVLSKTISLIDGDNVCYILVTNVNDINLYTVTIRRRPIYTVAFDTSGGTSIDSQQVEEDSLAAKPADPNRIGYDFSGYDYDFNKPIVKDTTINAKWQIITYKISYVLDGGINNAYNPTTYTVADKIELKPATKTGYTLKWSDNGIIEKGSTGDKIFTANWQVITYKIGYVLDGGTNNADNPTTYTVEDKIELKPATKTGYTFTSWDNSGAIEKGSTGDKTFTANWQIIIYKISYMLNGGINDAQNPTTYTVEDKIELKSAIKTGYSCKWDSGGVIEKGNTGDKIFTANYMPITYKITYDCGIGENNANNVGTYNIESKTIKLLDTYYINADFVEWQRGGVKITEIPTGTYGDITLTAVWSEYDVKLKLNDDGETYTVIGLNTDKTDIEIKARTKNITSIGDNAFQYCSKLTSIAISNSVISIGNYVFQGCNFKTITIPNSVKSIGSYAFRDCSFLTSVTLPDSVKSIGNGGFYDCNSLTSLTIGNGVTSIGNYAFDGCTALNYNEYGDAYYLGNDNNPYFVLIKAKSKGITDCNISEKCKFICDYAFYDCTSLTSVNIPDRVTSIGYKAFGGCSKLTNININDNNKAYKSIDGNLYSKDGKTLIQYAIGKTNTSFTIPDCVTSINGYAFYGCTKLTSVTIPDSVTSIGSSAFYYCTSLTSVNIPDSVTSIGSSAFYYCTSLTSITIGNGVTSIDNDAFNGCSKLTSVNIPDGVTSIGKNAFCRCTLLTSVTIPDNVTSIGDGAFYGCTSLTSVNIPDGVTSIGVSAFAICTSLTSVTIPDSVTSIGVSAFWGCKSLTSVIIFYGVVSIGDGAFSYCTSLTSVTIPNSVTRLGELFYKSTSLTTLNYAGTKKEWGSIDKETDWNNNSKITTIKCTDGEIYV